MALSLGCSKGHRIQIGSKILKVIEVRNHNKVLIEFDGVVYLVTDEERTRLMPEVYVQVGLARGSAGLTRLAIDAPRSIKITRLGLHEDVHLRS